MSIRNVRWIADVDQLTIGEALGQPDWDWTAKGWNVEQDSDAEGAYYLKSAMLGDDSVAVLSTVVAGPADLSFAWKVSSEAAYDYLDFVVDGDLVSWVDGEEDWNNVTIRLTNGVHEIKWMYSKDESGSEGEDRAWLRDVTFKTATEGVPVVVPYSWLASYPAIMSRAKGDFETAASLTVEKTSSAGKTFSPVWQDYVAGTDPTDATDEFKATIEIVDGEAKVSWSPKLSAGEELLRTYTTYGCREIGGAWVDMDNVPSAEKAGYKFFKVTVEMK